MRGNRLWDVGVRMRDGVRLSADIYLPAGGTTEGPYPTVLCRTPYDNQGAANPTTAEYLAEHGYAVVQQHVRGRYNSGGDWRPFHNEGADGFDTMAWLAEQPWCDGRVGTMGISYEGWTQWALAKEKPPNLRTMVSTAACGRWMQEVPFHNGVLALGMFAWLNRVGRRTVQSPHMFAENLPDTFRHLPVGTMDQALDRDLPAWREWLSHPALDYYWRKLRLDRDYPAIDVPVLHITGWYDDDQSGALYFHQGMSTGSPRSTDQHLLLGPWDHDGTLHPRRTLGGIDFGPESVVDMKEVHRDWFDRWLRGDGRSAKPTPRSRVFFTGANAWRDLRAWPAPCTFLHYYLRSAGLANTRAGDGALATELPTGDEPADRYAYDPADPVPSLIDERMYFPDMARTPLDHGFKHDRQDVLVYTGPEADDQVVITGTPVLHLFAASDCSDTDFFTALHDVSPAGGSMLLAEGRCGGRFRTDLSRPTPLEPGQVVKFVIQLGAVGHVLHVGHRLRLTVTSSDFPTWNRNLNTGEPIDRGVAMRVANNQVIHTATQPSHLVLPVLENGDG